MKALIALLVLSLATSEVLASDMAATVYLTLLHHVLLFWPLVLPLAYVRDQVHKAHLYVFLVIAVFGILGLVRYPYALLLTLGNWSTGEVSRSAAVVNIAINALAFLVCLLCLPRARSLIRQPHERSDA